jgi:hypothetical protein
VNVPKSRKKARKARGVKKEGRVARKRGGQHEVALPILPQTGRGLAVGGGYDIRLNSLPGCPPYQEGGRKTRKARKARRGGGYDIRLNSLPSCPPQSGMGLSWSDYPLHSTDDLRKRYSLGTKTLKRRQN